MEHHTKVQRFKGSHAEFKDVQRLMRSRAIPATPTLCMTVAADMMAAGPPWPSQTAQELLSVQRQKPQFTKPGPQEGPWDAAAVTGEVPPMPWHQRQVVGSTHWHPPQFTLPGSQFSKARAETLPRMEVAKVEGSAEPRLSSRIIHGHIARERLDTPIALSLCQKGHWNSHQV